eukprot:274477-Pleurochrysis_carterae.AAC.4
MLAKLSEKVEAMELEVESSARSSSASWEMRGDLDREEEESRLLQRALLSRDLVGEGELTESSSS